MKWRDRQNPFFRALTAVLIVVVGAGASWAPAAACGGCAAGAAGDATVVTAEGVPSAAPAHACCQEGTDSQAGPASAPADGERRDHHPGGCPDPCAACCL